MAQDSTPDPAVAIRCGEFVQAIYDSDNPNEGPYLHLPLFGKGELFTMVHESNLSPKPDDPAGQPYGVSRYLYRTAEEKTVWGGYIAESSEKETQFLGRRDIVVALRGTVGQEEGIADIEAVMSDFSFVQTPASGASVHAGFLSVYTSIGPDATSFGAVSLRDQIFKELGSLIPGEGATSFSTRITVTGHSLGAALATLVACDVGSNFAPAKLDTVTVCLITFASPKVGNAAFKTNTEGHTSFIWRYCSVADPVPSLPPTIPLLFPYVHVGTELLLDWTASPYVSLSWSPVTTAAHRLELHMHVLAAADGIGVYTSMEGLLPDLPPSEAAPTVDALIDWVSQLPRWEAQDRSRLRQKLEEVTQLLGDDGEALRQYLRKVAYVGNQRDPEADAVGGDQDAPFGVRDYALLNKDSDLLKPEFSISPNWLVHPNKDMVLDLATMKWLPRVQRPSDIPTPSNPDYN